MNIDKYPRAKELLNEVNLIDKVNQIKWLQFSKEEAAVSLAKAYIVALAGASSNPFLKEKSRKLTDQLYFSIGYKLHGFAKDEGNAQLGYETEDIIKLYKHISFGGIKYTQQSLK